MKNKFRYYIVALLLLTLCSKVHSQAFEKQKTISKSMAVGKECSMQLENKYGDIHLIPWEKDSMVFMINVKASNRKEVEAEKMLNAIDVEFTATEYYVIAKTIIKDTKNQIISDIGDMANDLFNLGKSMEIDYIIYLPKWAGVKINNKYGNVYTANHTAAFQLTMANGDFQANQLSGNNVKIDISFGNITLSEISNGNITLSYGELDVKKVNTLNISSRSSKLYIGNAETLDINTKRDKINLDTLSTIKMQSDFSYITILKVKSSAFLNTSYGEVKIDGIDSTLKYCSISSSYTDLSFDLAKDASVILDLSGKKTETIYPASITGLNKQILNEKTDEFKLNGSIGENSLKTALTIISTGGSFMLSIH